MMPKHNLTAILIGATGLVGSALLKQLLKHESFEKVKVFHRRSTSVKHEKLEEYIIDFDDPGSWNTDLQGDVLFSCLGTTLKTAGSKEAQLKVDYTYQLDVAKAAAENGISQYVLVSSAGADSKSLVFYSKMKGKLDEEVRQLSFDKITIMRPSVLDGDRGEYRGGEQLGLKFMRLMKDVPFIKKYRPIHADIVARAMINMVLNPANRKYSIYELDTIFSL